MAHPLHVSFTSIEINAEKHEASLVYKFFTDDFSLLFYHLYEKNVIPQADTEFKENELKIINKYLNGAFQLVAGRDTLLFTYVKKEQNEESVWLHYKASLSGKRIKTLMLTNKLLLDLYEDQTNLVIISDGLAEKGYTFNFRERQSEIWSQKE
jgi:hypothetical protein